MITESKPHPFQGISKRAHVAWTLVRQGGSDRAIQIPLYDDPQWAEGDVVVHNECFGVTDAEWLETSSNLTPKEVPAVFIHCSLHSCRGADTDAWRSLIGPVPQATNCRP